MADDGLVPLVSTLQEQHSKRESEGSTLRPRCASSGPFRVHVIIPHDEGESEASLQSRMDACDCKRQHVVYGRTYRYCTCGFSKSQPFCDDTHLTEPKAKGFEPLPVTIDKKQTVRTEPEVLLGL